MSAQNDLKDALKPMFRMVLDDPSPTRAVPALFRRTSELWDDLQQRGAGIDAVCQSGCAHCCHLPVMCPPDVVSYIAHYIQTVWPQDDQDSLLLKLAQEATFWDQTSDIEKPLLRRRCPLLLSGSDTCRIYTVRPFSCRAFSSADVSACDRLHHHQGNAVPQDDHQFTLYQMATTVLSALAQREGREGEQVYFIPALYAALK